METIRQGLFMNRQLKLKIFVFILVVGFAIPAVPQQKQGAETIDEGMISALRQEELDHSQALDHVVWLADVYGPRVTGTPGFKAAGDWAMKKLREWGLSNVHTEHFLFGSGWSLTHFDAQMTEPQNQPLIGYPKVWTPGTPGSVEGDVMRVQIDSESDFAKYKGKLKGRIVLPQAIRPVDLLTGIVVERWTPELLRESETTPLSGPSAGPSRSSDNLATKTQQFFKEEGVACVLDRGIEAYTVHGDNQMSWLTQRTDGGTVFVTSGGNREKPNGGDLAPEVTLAVEHYNRLIRILDRKVPVKVAINIQSKFYPENKDQPNGANIVAEIEGSDLRDEQVLLGAHLDSWQSATGATDNAAGVAVMMEALRLLKAVGAKPRRTIRIALWGGEEQGELGSKAYVKEHLLDKSTKTLKSDYKKLSAYYNLDNGTGRIRGIWLQENLADASIFKAWFQSFSDLGVSGTIAPRSVAGSDYQSFDEVGIPSFQFMQDRLEYNSRTHHSNMDVVDRIQKDDLTQMAIIVASFAYNTATRNEQLPRKSTVITGVDLSVSGK